MNASPGPLNPVIIINVFVQQVFDIQAYRCSHGGNVHLDTRIDQVLVRNDQ